MIGLAFLLGMLIGAVLTAIALSVVAMNKSD